MGTLHFEVADGVATLTLDEEKTRNAFSTAIAIEMLAACDEIDHDESIGAAIIRGAHGTFCSGADRRDLLSPEGGKGMSGYRQEVQAAFVRFGELLVPTIAAVTGAAIGAGINLMLTADTRIVARDARLNAGFLRIGIHPGGGFYSLSNRVGGREVTSAMGLFGEEISGSRAVELGMAWEAVDRDEVDPRALELARRAASDPELSRVSLRSMRAIVGPPASSWNAAVEIERGAQTWSRERLFARRAAEEAARG